MPWILNVIYLIILTLAAPLLLWRRWRQGKRLGGPGTKLSGNVTKTISRSASATGTTPTKRVWLHAVSVGEVLLLQPIINALRQEHHELWLSVSTATGREVAEKTYPDLHVIWFPFDFSWAVNRAIHQVQPALILLAELELWPNFISAAQAKQIPVVVINGRISERSYQGYRRFRWLTSKLLSKIDWFAVQQVEYAERLRLLGMPADRIIVTGSVKFDGVTANRDDPKVAHLRRLLNITNDQLVWVVGSTQSPEEAWALDIYREAKQQFPTLHLILVPRHQERFHEVAKLLDNSGSPYQRRSQLNAALLSTQDSALSTYVSTQHSGLSLIDTLGELKACWGLADVGFVGGSFNDRGGQNMIEPAAYGVAVTFGPNTWNFKQVVASLLHHQAAIEVKSKEDWQTVTLRLLGNAAERAAIGERAKAFVASQQGATGRTMEVLAKYLDSSPPAIVDKAA